MLCFRPEIQPHSQALRPSDYVKQAQQEQEKQPQATPQKPLAAPVVRSGDAEELDGKATMPATPAESPSAAASTAKLLRAPQEPQVRHSSESKRQGKRLQRHKRDHCDHARAELAQQQQAREVARRLRASKRLVVAPSDKARTNSWDSVLPFQLHTPASHDALLPSLRGGLPALISVPFCAGALGACQQGLLDL